MSGENNLTALLIQLSRSTVKIAKKAHEERRIKKFTVQYLREKITNLSYNEGNMGYQSTVEEISKEEIDWRSLFELENSEIKTLSEFDSTVNIISKMFNVNTAQADFWVRRFVQVVISKSLDNATEDKIIEIMFSFIRDLEKTPILWIPTVWLDGIWLVEDRIELSEEIIFRKPVALDLEYELNPSFLFSVRNNVETMPQVILNFSKRAKDQHEMMMVIERLLLILRLFKLGSVSSIKTFWKSESILSLGSTSITGRFSINSPSYKYSLSVSDVEKLKEFQNIIEKLIPPVLIGQGSGEVDYLVIAIQRYNDSILKPEIMESRLSFAIMCMEALYLKKDERQELEHRLSQRVAKVLTNLGHQPLEVYNRLKRAYGVRSSFVHGSPIEKEELNDLPKLTENIIEYARLSIVIQLLLKSKYDKEKLLSLTDNSLLSEDASEKLEKLFKEDCKILLRDC